MLLLDLDGFKAVNDRHGHDAGDDGADATAEALRARLRTTDLLARLGGDEFATVLPHVDRPRPMTSPRTPSGRRDLAGAASRPDRVLARPPSPSPSRPPGVLREADRAMYAAKRRGARPFRRPRTLVRT